MSDKLKLFTIRGIKGNKTKNIEIEALTPVDAEIIALSYVDTILMVKEKSNFKLLKKGMSAKERNTFLHTLATLASSLNVDVALRQMTDYFKGSIQDASRELLKKVEQGKEIESAFDEIGEPHFPANIVAMIKATMATGSFTDALREASDFETEMMRIKKESGGGIFKAIGAFLFAAFVILISQFWFVPWMLSGDMAELMQNTDLTATNTLSWSTSISMLVLVAIAGFMLFISTVGKKVFPLLADNIILAIPFFKDLVLAKRNYITVYQLAILLGKGVQIKTALLRAIENTDKGRLRNDFENALINLQEGRTWSDALSSFNVMDKAALKASDDQEKIAKTLSELAISYKNSYKKTIEALNVVMFIISILYLALAILILFLYTTLPVFTMIQGGFSV